MMYFLLEIGGGGGGVGGRAKSSQLHQAPLPPALLTLAKCTYEVSFSLVGSLVIQRTSVF